MTDESIASVEEFMSQVNQDVLSWKESVAPWFRGQPVDKPLFPKLFRQKVWSKNENNIVQDFRMRGRSLGQTPDREKIDEWLVLMQHCGLPTRLLDWTEGALTALFFALDGLQETGEKDRKPVVWMLHPMRLNQLSVEQHLIALSWVSPGIENFQLAFTQQGGHELPVAVYPPNIHTRVYVQKSCFTIHGKDKKDVYTLFKHTELVQEGYLKKYEISSKPSDTGMMVFTLKLMGISYSTLFPDLDGLAKDIAFWRGLE